MHVRFDGPRSDKLYVRLDPLAGGTGGGGSDNAGGNTAQLVSTNRTDGPVPVASNTNTVTNASNRNYAVPTFEALRSSSGFEAASDNRPSSRAKAIANDRRLEPLFIDSECGTAA